MALLENKRDLLAPANIVTYFRLVSIPFICLLMLQPGAKAWWGFGLFVLAAASDKLDGWLAKRNDGRGITKLGMFLDPIVDKLLVLAVLSRAIFLTDGALRMQLIVVVVGIALRELVVGWVKSGQKLQSAAEAGRFSMVVQSMAVTLLVLPRLGSEAGHAAVTSTALYAALGASLCSGWLYVMERRTLRADGKPLTLTSKHYRLLTIAVIAGGVLSLVAGRNPTAQNLWQYHAGDALMGIGIGALCCLAWSDLRAEYKAIFTNDDTNSGE